MLRTVSAFTPVIGIPAEEPDHFLTCPVCGQTLVQPDVETFSRCPYCDHVFVKDQAMEDFLLEPAVKAWVKSQNFLPVQFRIDDLDEQ
jgi:uncharacterized C2H2 Zn-finger protein